MVHPADLLTRRELDDAHGLTDIAGAALSKSRRGKNTRHVLTGLLKRPVEDSGYLPFFYGPRQADC